LRARRHGSGSSSVLGLVCLGVVRSEPNHALGQRGFAGKTRRKPATAPPELPRAGAFRRCLEGRVGEDGERNRNRKTFDNSTDQRTANRRRGDRRTINRPSPRPRPESPPGKPIVPEKVCTTG
jgi:hypothetical protein